MPTCVRGGIALIAWMAVAGPQGTNLLAASAADPPASAITNQSPRLKSPATVVRLPPRLAEIVRMVKARLDHEVVQAYIRSSNSPFNPSAADIVVLKRLDIPQDLITTMLERDGELQRRLSQSTGAQASVVGQLGPVQPLPVQPPYYAGPPNYVYSPAPHRSAGLILFGPATSFNNSFPTFINGQALYSGYYIPAFAF